LDVHELIMRIRCIQSWIYYLNNHTWFNISMLEDYKFVKHGFSGHMKDLEWCSPFLFVHNNMILLACFRNQSNWMIIACFLTCYKMCIIWTEKKNVQSLARKNRDYVGFRGPNFVLHGAPEGLAMVRSQMRKNHCSQRAPWTAHVLTMICGVCDANAASIFHNFDLLIAL